MHTLTRGIDKSETIVSSLASSGVPREADTTPVPSFTPSYRAYVLCTLSVIGFLCSVDRVVITMFLQPIKLEFALSDTQLGIMTGLAFSVLGGMAAVPLARLADRTSRKWIIAGSLMAWTVLTAATGMAMSFSQLLAARIGVGIGEAGCVPATHSIIGDYYPRALRSRALGIFSASQFLGIFGGLLGGGILVQTLGWRVGFIALGVGGLVLSAIFQLTVREPIRIDQIHAAHRISGGVLRRLGDPLCFVLLVVAFSTTALAGSVAAWLPVYFDRAFHLSPVHIGLGLGLSLGVASAIGSVGGGYVGTHYMRHSRSWGAGFSAIISLVVMPLYLGTFFAPDANLAFALLFITFLVAGFIVGPVFATVQDLVDPSVRATAIAIVALSGVVIGQGVGPVLVGMLSDLWTSTTNDAGGLRMAMTALAMINFLTVTVFWALKRRIERVLPVPVESAA